MRLWIALVALLYATFAVVSRIERVFYRWWGVPEESLLPLMAAAAVVVVPVLLLQAINPGLRSKFKRDDPWAEDHPVKAAAIFAAPTIGLAFVPPVHGSESWAESATWAVGGSGAVFAVLVILFAATKAVRAREARKRNIEPADYKPGRLARGVVTALAVLLGLYLAIGFTIELSDVLG